MVDMIKQEMMQAIIFNGIGGTDVIETSLRPIPSVGVGEVLIKIAAAGMNRADILQRLGKHPPAKGVTDIPGLEVAGSIVGEGTRICVLLSGGGYAGYVAVHRALCFETPSGMDMVMAAGLPEALFTVTKNVFVLGALKKDEHLLIHGGASGIGTLAIQMAKSIGARVSITAGSEARCALCMGLGADRAINYKTHDFVDILKNDPVDVVLDMVGGDTLTRDIQIMNFAGRHVSIAYLSGARAQIDIATIMKNKLTITGSMLRHDSLSDKIKLADIIRKSFWPLVISGQIKPVIDKVFPLSEARAAHNYFELGQHAGKIILTVDN